MLEIPVRLGIPEKVGGLSDTVNTPLYATGVGLVLYGSKNKSFPNLYRASGENLFKNIIKRLGMWFKEYF